MRDIEEKQRLGSHLKHTIIGNKDFDDINQYDNYGGDNHQVRLRVNKPKIVLKKGLKVSLKK